MAQGQGLPLVGKRIDLDIIEKVTVVGLLTFFALRLIPVTLNEGGYLNVILLVSEAIVVVFVLLRRPAKVISGKVSDWLVGFAGTSLALCVAPAEGPALISPVACGVLMLSGLLLSLTAKLTLRRSFGIVAANRGVKVSGPYRLVRHPMYAGYALLHAAYFLSGPTIWNGAIYGTVTALQVARILAEERILVTDPSYQAFRAKVRSRLIPFVF